MGRWFAIDPALQAASPYMAMGNNPMMMIDEDGEWVFAALAVGALIGAGSYTASIAFSKGGFDNWNWGGFFQSAGMGAVSGVATGGIGNALNGMSGFGTEALRAGMHGVTQGGLGAIQGDNFLNGFASGALSSIATSGFQAVGGDFANSTFGGTSFGALSGGIGAELSGGDFWRGAGQGTIVALLNHYMKPLQQRLERLGKVNLKKNPVRGFKRWMRYINRYKGFDPVSRRPFNLSDIVEYGTVPKKYWFKNLFGGMMDDKVNGTSKINGKNIRWNIEDREISPSNRNNINFIQAGKVSGQNNVDTFWRIGAYRSSSELIFNLVFYEYETFKEYNNYIFNK